MKTPIWWIAEMKIEHTSNSQQRSQPIRPVRKFTSQSVESFESQL
ncbi:hypothetical protein [Nostoc sp.]